MRSVSSTRLARAIPCLLLAAAIGGCSILMKKDTEYRKAEPAPPLKIPAGLSTPRPNPETEIPKLPSGRDKGAPVTGLDVPPDLSLESNDITVVSDGALHWLLVQASEDDLWQRVKDFWKENDIALAYENGKYYLMETGWAAPRRAAAGSPGDRIKYRVRLVQFPDEDGTELYLNAYTRGQAPDLDASLGSGMLTRLAKYLGGPGVNTAKLLTRPAAQKVAALEDDKDRGLFLKLDRSPEMAWRHVAQAVARLGYAVVGQTREKKYDVKGGGTRREKGDRAKDRKTRMGEGKRGLSGRRGKADQTDQDYDEYGHRYLISTSLPTSKAERKQDKGWFSWLFFSHSDTVTVTPDFTLSLAPAGSTASRLTVGDDPSAGAGTEKDRKILNRIYESLD